jgi:hypothetical protein
MTPISSYILFLFSFLLLVAASALADNHFQVGAVDSVIQVPQVAGEVPSQEMPAAEAVKKEKEEMTNIIRLEKRKKHRKPKALRYPRCSECD